LLHILIVTEKPEGTSSLLPELSQDEFISSIASTEDEVKTKIVEEVPDFVLVDTDHISDDSKLWELCGKIKQQKPLPVMALVSPKTLKSADARFNFIDDFMVRPGSADELAFRAKRLLGKSRHVRTGELIQYGDLVIDLANYEVLVDGRPVTLSFKEYELLKYLASNPGRVFTRDKLLNKVWGFDYFGGDRTVDVHIRRLRSKLEDPGHIFIDTVRNVGYRFKKSV